MPKPTSITFVATVYKVQTLIDRGLRVTLDLSENAIAEVAALMECKRQEIPLHIHAEIKPQEKPGKARDTIA